MSLRSLQLLVVLLLTMTTVLNHENTTTLFSVNDSQGQRTKLAPLDPSVPNVAFNVTLAQFDLYTRNTATLEPTDVSPGILTWSDSTIDGRLVEGTRFIFEIPTSTSVSQNITWTITIPRGNYTGSGSSPTFLRFRWNGTVTTGTNASYILRDTTSIIHQVVHTGNFTSGQSPSSLPCLSDEECFDVSAHIGKSLSLVFRFNSNSTGQSLKVEVSHVAVASVSRQLTHPAADIHIMSISSNQVVHTANSTIVAYNTTALQPQGNTHHWNSTALIFRLPAAYTLNGISLNGTSSIYPGATLDDGTCTPRCSNRLPIGNATVTDIRFISFNATSPFDEVKAAIADTSATSSNSMQGVEALLGGVATDLWMPGDTVGVRVVVQPSLNVSGSQTIIFTDPSNSTRVNPPPFNNKGGTYVYNLTLPSPAPLGIWNITAVFLSGYSYGHLVHEIRLEQLRTSPISLGGEAGLGKVLSVSGTLTYVSDSTPAEGVSATVFVVDAGSPPAPLSLPGPAFSQLYISNISFTNGVFRPGEALIAYFTIANPTPSTGFFANITIVHKWYDGTGGEHGVNMTIPLSPSFGEPFNSPSSFYRMDIVLTLSGVQVAITSLATSNKVTRMLPPGTAGVPSTRQHFGTLEMSVTSEPVVGGGKASSPLAKSPTYAYVLHAPLFGSRLLVSSTVSTSTGGGFSTSINADKVLAAKRLAVFVLARNSNGIAIAADQMSTVFDSTVLFPDAEIPSEVTVSQFLVVSLSLTNNSTRLPVTLSVDLYLSGSGKVSSKTITIQPGATQTTTFDFTAPASAGSYVLTFSSAEYGGPILPKTLQVVLLPSALQTLIPAIVALVAALVILGIYLIRRRPETEIEKEEKPRTAPGKPKPSAGSPGSKPLTRSQSLPLKLRS